MIEYSLEYAIQTVLDRNNNVSISNAEEGKIRITVRDRELHIASQENCCPDIVPLTILRRNSEVQRLKIIANAEAQRLTHNPTKE